MLSQFLEIPKMYMLLGRDRQLYVMNLFWNLSIAGKEVPAKGYSRNRGESRDTAYFARFDQLCNAKNTPWT
jgi:hypothetical protein